MTSTIISRQLPPGVSHMWTVWAESAGTFLAAFDTLTQAQEWIDEVGDRQERGESMMRTPAAEMVIVHPARRR